VTVAVHFARGKDATEETVGTIVEAGGKAFTVQAELSTLSGVADLFAQLDQKLVERTGNNQFDILVNNAGALAPGVLRTPLKRFLNFSFA